MARPRVPGPRTTVKDDPKDLCGICGVHKGLHRNIAQSGLHDWTPPAQCLLMGGSECSHPPVEHKPVVMAPPVPREEVEFVVVMRIKATPRQEGPWSFHPDTIRSIMNQRIRSRTPRLDYDLDVSQVIMFAEDSK